MDLLNHLRRALEIRRIERRTIEELSWCSDRDLADIGISRADIRSIARATARDAAVGAGAQAPAVRDAGRGGLPPFQPAGRLAV